MVQKTSRLRPRNELLGDAKIGLKRRHIIARQPTIVLVYIP